MEFLKPLKGRVTEKIRIDLSKEFTVEEITKALKQIHLNKAPDPDGMSTLFFQKYWGIVGDIVLAGLLQVLNSGHLPKNLNHTHISLIPKKK